MYNKFKVQYRPLSRGKTLMLIVILALTFSFADSQNGAYFDKTSLELPKGTQTIEVPIVLTTEFSYACADFEIEVVGNAVVQAVRLSDERSATVLGPIRRNKVEQFGIFSAENRFKGTQKVAVIRVDIWGDAPVQLILKKVTAIEILTGDKVSMDADFSTSLKRTELPVKSTLVIKPVTAIEDPKVKIPKFTDIASTWAKTYIESMASQGYIKGISELNFSPEHIISRADFIQITMRILGADLEKLGAGSDMPFKDVHKGDYFYQAVKGAKVMGLITTQGSGPQFKPLAPITRQEMMVIVYRALLWSKAPMQLSPDLKAFSDGTAVLPYAELPIRALVGSGVVKGSGEGAKYALKLNNTLTRAEAAKILFELKRYLTKVHN